MIETTRELSAQEMAEKLVAAVDARSAADEAARIAKIAAEWASRSHAAVDDATEVWAAAARARQAAEQAEIVATAEEAQVAARAAWAALQSAMEADARINEAIADSLTTYDVDTAA